MKVLFIRANFRECLLFYKNLTSSCAWQILRIIVQEFSDKYRTDSSLWVLLYEIDHIQERFTNQRMQVTTLCHEHTTGSEVFHCIVCRSTVRTVCPYTYIALVCKAEAVRWGHSHTHLRTTSYTAFQQHSCSFSLCSSSC